MTLLRPTVLVVCMCIVTSHVAAQEIKLITFRSDSGVHLRWIGNTDPGVTAWMVERSTDGGAYEQLTPEPLPFITSYKEMQRRVGRYLASYYLTLFGVMEERDITPQDILRTLQSPNVNLHFALRAAAPELAQLSGEYYFDKAPPGSACVYRVIPLRDTQRRPPIETASLTLSTIDRIPIPSDVDARGFDGTAQLTWPRNANSRIASEIVGFRVWKGASEFGPFEEVTLQTSIAVHMSKDSMNSNTWSDDLVENGDTLYYYVNHIHATGVASSRSNVTPVVIGVDEAPAMPQGLLAQRFGHVVRLTWKWPWRGPRAQRVEVRRFSDADSNVKTHTVGGLDTSYTDALTTMGNVYHYTLVVYSNSDSATSDTVTFALTDVVAPKTPLGLTAVSDTAMIHLSWNRSSSDDVEGYIVMVASDPKLRNYLQLRSALLTDTSLTDTLHRETEGLQAYVVIAQDRVGNTSAPSKPVIARPVDITPPAPSQIVEFRRESKSIHLRYTASISLDVASYMVQKQLDSGEWTLVSNTRSLEVNDSLVKPGVFEYRVIVVDSAHNSSVPSQTRGTTLRPELEAPASLTVKRESFALRLQWSKVDGAAGYEIARVDEQTGERIVMDNVKDDETEWADSFSDAEKAWRYEIAARTASWHIGPHRYVVYQPTKQ